MAVRKPAAHRGSGTHAERSAQPPTAMIRRDVIGLIVADLLRSIAFYEQLGLQFQENPDAEGHGHVETTIRGGVRFTLDTEESIRSFDPDWTPPAGGHGTTIPFRCDAQEDVDRLYAQLVEAGAPGYKSPWDASGASDTRR
jgi:catechol 2,3-dioxygenase-like lactoylglutathione lyase family enzyme